AAWFIPTLRPEDVAAACERALALCRAAVRARATKVLVTTFGAHDAGAPDPAQAALWGLIRTFAREHPDRWGGLLDLPAPLRSDAGQLVTLALEAADA